MYTEQYINTVVCVNASLCSDLHNTAYFAINFIIKSYLISSVFILLLFQMHKLFFTSTFVLYEVLENENLFL